MRLISKGEFAKERGVSAGRVSQWLHDGRVAETDGKIDADQAHAALDAALDRTKGMRRSGNVTSTRAAHASGGEVAPGDKQQNAPTVTAGVQTSESGMHGETTKGASSALRPDAAAQDSAHGAGAGKTGELALDRSAPAGDASVPAAPNAAAPREAVKDTTAYWEHKSKREKFDAELAEMKFLQAAGALVPAAGVRHEAMETARAIRNAVLAIPDRVAAALDPANPARAHKLLTEEIQKVMREQTDRLEQRAAGGMGDAGPVASAAGERQGALQ